MNEAKQHRDTERGRHGVVPLPHPLERFPEWINILEAHRDTSAGDFALRYRDKRDWPVREIAEQIHCYPRAEEKLGSLHRRGMIYTREALEQASGYAAATFRATGWAATKVADLTGGLGIDSAAWALSGAHVTYYEQNAALAGIARHNHQLLGIGGQVRYYIGDAMELLADRKAGSGPDSPGNVPNPDLIYMDPSRRASGRRVRRLDEYQPRVPDHLALIRSSAGRYLIKLSPMLDTADLMRQLPDVRRFLAVSVDGEVKELLADCQPDQTPDSEPGNIAGKEAVLLDRYGSVHFHAVEGDHRDSAAQREDSGTSTPAGTPVWKRPAGEYLFEADPAIFKMRLINEVAQKFGLRRIHPEIGYLTGGGPVPDFPGRTYHVRQIHPFKPKKIRKWLEENDLRRVHIHRRGFPLTVEQLYKKLACTMGEGAHLIATMDDRGDLIIVVADMV